MTPNELFQWFWVFFIYAFVGWCVEVVFHALSEGKFINRGFLNGPVCPIYGFGVLIVALCLEPVKDSILYLFIGSVVLTSALEFITGFILEKVFNDKWWDYSKEPLNLCGYICLRFSLVWGLACVLIVDVFYPLTIELIEYIPQTFGIVMLAFFTLLMLTDMTITIVETFKLRKKLVVLERTEKGIRKVSDGIGSVLASGTINAAEKFELGKEAVEQKKARAKSELSAVQARLILAYPRLEQGRYKESLSLLIHHFKKANELAITNSKLIPIDSPVSVLHDLPIVLYRSTFETIIDVLEARDEYTAGHSRRVAVLTKQFCKYLKVSPLETELFELSASVHDLGKVGIADATLNKCDKLDEYEWTEMRRHPDIGADIILKSCKLDSVADIVRHHHEHWDGSGYPNGLSGSDIPKGAQIVAICDAVDSMMIKRVYRQAFLPDECKSEVENCKGTAFNPDLADIFLNNWSKIITGVYSDDGRTEASLKPSFPKIRI